MRLRTAAWLARRGARPTGIDVTPAQLGSARSRQQRSGVSFPLVEADAGDVPLPPGSFDLAISECGASLWRDPARWVPQAARLVFHTTSTLLGQLPVRTLSGVGTGLAAGAEKRSGVVLCCRPVWHTIRRVFLRRRCLLR